MWIPHLHFSFSFLANCCFSSISISSTVRTVISLKKHTCPLLHQHFVHISVILFTTLHFNSPLYIIMFSSRDCEFPKYIDDLLFVYVCLMAELLLFSVFPFFFGSFLTHKIKTVWKNFRNEVFLVGTIRVIKKLPNHYNLVKAINTYWRKQFLLLFCSSMYIK